VEILSSNGKLWSEGKYENGTRIGKSATYYENGNLRIKGAYKDGKPYGNGIFMMKMGN